VLNDFVRRSAEDWGARFLLAGKLWAGARVRSLEPEKKHHESVAELKVNGRAEKLTRDPRVQSYTIKLSNDNNLRLKLT
jgi:hypothetical protein